MISFCQLGAGRIGAIHAENIARHPAARLGAIVDVDPTAAEQLARRYGSEVGTQVSVLADRSIHAVVIASSTNTHADLVEAAACTRQGRLLREAARPRPAARRALRSSANAACR
jgi:myo-inositol 2-dehydrogenase / D-chiro-inositol 1-dehydrogenase